VSLSALSLSICNQGFLIASGLIGLGALIAFHELGHFLMCKLFNISTPSFSIGFGPRIITKKIGETEFSLSLIPLGGYVEIAGNAEMGQGEQKMASATDKTSFASKTFCQKILVMLGGILFNIIFAYAAFTIVLFVGIKNPPPLFGTKLTSAVEVKAATPIALQSGDQIVSIDDFQSDNPDELISTIAKSPDKAVLLNIIREGVPVQLEATISSKKAGDTSVGYLTGVSFVRENVEPHSFWAALKTGISLTHQIMSLTIDFFLTLPARIGKNIWAVTDQIAGPIKLIAMVGSSASDGYISFLILLAIISINLAVFNLVPLPIVDGGQILTCVIEDVTGRQLPLRIKEIIFIATWVFIIALIVLVSFGDIKSLLFSAKTTI